MPMPSFKETFGQVGPVGNEVKYSRPVEMKYLPVPQISDSLDILEKVDAIVEVASKGESVAVHMGLLSGFTIDTTEDVEKGVISRMMPAEKAQYEAWKEGFTMPEFDWKIDKMDISFDVAAESRYNSMVEAMKIIWKTDKVTLGNAAYMASRMQYAMPLLLAVTKIEEAKKKTRWGFPKDPSAMDQVELETIERITDTVSKNVSETLRKTNLMGRVINAAMEGLMSRKRVLNAKVKKGIVQKDNKNSKQAGGTKSETPQDAIVGDSKANSTTEEKAASKGSNNRPAPSLISEEAQRTPKSNCTTANDSKAKPTTEAKALPKGSKKRPASPHVPEDTRRMPKRNCKKATVVDATKSEEED